MTTLTITNIESGQMAIKVIDNIAVDAGQLATLLNSVANGQESVALYRIDGSAVLIGDGVLQNSVFEISN